MLTTWLVVPDLHFPYHDKRYTELITKVIKKLKPDGMVQLGDFVDFFQLSEYDKDPGRVNQIHEDLAEYSEQLDEWEKALPKGSVFYQLEGNHETRLHRYTHRRAPQVHKLVRSLPEMLRFKERNLRGKVSFEWFPYGKWDACFVGDVCCHHGFFYNTHVAHTILSRYRAKLLCGHSHRIDYRSDGMFWAATLGHGSNEKLTAHQPTPTGWQQAFGILSVIKGKGSLEVVEVRNGRCILRGELI